MARELKCRHCGEKSEKELMIAYEKESKNGTIRHYYHSRICYDAFVTQKNKEEHENILRDKLNILVKKIHRIPNQIHLPKEYWHVISDIRNGTERFTKGYTKKKKEGISYEVIIEAYNLSKMKIDYASRNIQFKSLISELRYGMKIVEQNFLPASKKIEGDKYSKKKSEIINKKQVKEIENNKQMEDFSDVYKFAKTKKTSYDMSNILDD